MEQNGKILKMRSSLWTYKSSTEMKHLFGDIVSTLFFSAVWVHDVNVV